MYEKTYQESHKKHHRNKAGWILGTIFAVLALSALAVWIFISNFVVVSGAVYAKNLDRLDLTGKSVSVSDYEALQQVLPECNIVWDVPFQTFHYPSDLDSLRVTELTDADIRQLAYFPVLKEIDATGCTDLSKVMELIQARPEVTVSYRVSIGGTAFDNDAQQITLTDIRQEDTALLAWLPELKTVDASDCRNYPVLLEMEETYPDVAFQYEVAIGGEMFPRTTTQLRLDAPDAGTMDDLAQRLACFPDMEQVYLTEPDCQPEVLKQMRQENPDVKINWEKTVFEKLRFSTDTGEIDLSGRNISLDDVEWGMGFLPMAEKVNLTDCKLDNQALAEFRDKVRSDYKVVWTVKVMNARVRTDETVFHSSGRKISLTDSLSQDLYYCEDLVVVDIGHSRCTRIDWVKGMPNLKYLIIADNWLEDISAISTCKNLVYLEVFMNSHLKDLSPLVECTALEDLNVIQTYGDLTPLAQMTWLKNLWANSVKLTAAEKQLLTMSLPNTHLEFNQGYPTGGGWRQLQNYYDMRDIMGLQRCTW